MQVAALRTAILLIGPVCAACGPSGPGVTDSASASSAPVTSFPPEGTDPTAFTSSTSADATDSSAEGPTPTGTDPGATGVTTFEFPDFPPDPTGDPVACERDGTCNQLDVLIVVDNSGSMGEEQRKLAAAMPQFVERLRGLVDTQGQPVGADVQVMVTTTDVAHPLCTPFNKPGYVPAMGAPRTIACVDHLESFTGIGGNVQIPEACTLVCPEGHGAAPDGDFVHFNPDADNVLDPDGEGDPVSDALACVVPQGIDGCGMEAPLEAMRLALQQDAPWNQGAQPFLRRGGALAVILLGDETDCSTENFEFFDPNNKDDPTFNQFWEDLPGMPGVKGEPTSAVCWNASISCDDANADGVFEDCVAEDKGVLFPRSRYIDLLHDLELAHKPVFMLALTGVPEVTAHDPEPPHGPIAGGLLDLVHHDWRPEDLLPGEVKTAAEKQFDFGIGPGCSDGASGYALPPGRIVDVCKALDVAADPGVPGDDGELRCCVESVCGDALDGAVACLTDMLAQRLRPM